MSSCEAPRLRNTVLSIRTQSREQKALRAAIEAAQGQQQRLKRRSKTRWSTEPTIREEPDCEENNSVSYTYSSCDDFSPVPRTQSVSSFRPSLGSSLRSFTGTVRGGLASAERFFKMTSRTHGGHSRNCSSASMSQRTLSSMPSPTLAGDDYRFDTGPCPVELSSVSVYKELEGGCTPARQSDDFSLPDSPLFEYDRKRDIERLLYEARGTIAEDLSNKSYCCDDCQQRLSGGDFYDFCPQCGPSDRVLCYSCAKKGGCSRHRPDRLTLDLARGSPAPPYSQPLADPDKGSSDQHESMTPPYGEEYENQDESVAERELPEAITQQQRQSHSENTSTVLETKLDDLTRQLQLMQAFVNGWKDRPESSERRSGESDLSQREQQAFLREQQLAVREQELLLRARESVCHDREILLVRNLQSLAITQELVKCGRMDPRTYASESGNGVFSDAQARHNPDVSSAQDKKHMTQHKPDHPQFQGRAAQSPKINASIDLSDIHTYTRSHAAQKRKKGNDNSSPKSNTSSHQGSRSGSHKHSSTPDKDNGQQEGDSSDPEDSEPQKRQKHELSDSDIPQRIFACPYYKHDPPRYSSSNLAERQYRGCSGHLLPDIPRLKQHLKRVHWRPEHHCPRCYEIFEDANKLVEHQQQATACTIQECPFPEKMDKTQQNRIHVKRPRTPAETLWYSMYEVLFPGSPIPDSPYAEQTESITPPSSAGPTSAPPGEEASHLMTQILNERLNKYQATPGCHDWLTVDDERQFILNEVHQSMQELLGRMAWTPTPSPGHYPPSAPPSTLSSPIEPAGRDTRTLRTVQALSGGLPIMPQSSTSVAVPRALPAQPAPQLKAPKPQLSPALTQLSQMLPRNPAPGRLQETQPPAPPFALPNPWAASSHSASSWPPESGTHYPPTSTSGPGAGGNLYQAPFDGGTNNGPVNLLAPGSFPSHLGFDNGWDEQCHSYEEGDDFTLDQGWDDQCNSYNEGDDQSAMAKGLELLQASNADFVSAGSSSTVPKRRQRNRSFVPVQLKSLDAEQPQQSDGNQRLKSVSSLVDSGYGSTSSSNSNARMQDAFPDDVQDSMYEPSPPGHTTFQEYYDQLNLTDTMGSRPNEE